MSGSNLLFTGLALITAGLFILAGPTVGAIALLAVGVLFIAIALTPERRKP